MFAISPRRGSMYPRIPPTIFTPSLSPSSTGGGGGGGGVEVTAKQTVLLVCTPPIQDMVASNRLQRLVNVVDGSTVPVIVMVSTWPGAKVAAAYHAYVVAPVEAA